MELAIFLTRLLPLLSSIDLRFRPRLVVVEGNVGSGKSTLLQRLQLTHNETVRVMEEPVNKWANFSNVDLLQKLFEDSQRWAFAFQLYSSLTRYVDLLEALRDWDQSKRVLVMERSVYSGRFCFLEAERELGSISEVEFAILDKWYRTMDQLVGNAIRPDKIVYLRSDMESLERHIGKRNRAEESKLDLDFLRLVQKWHDKWLRPNINISNNRNKEEERLPLPPAPVLTFKTGHMSLQEFEAFIDAEADRILYE